jgi:hypothetical protein
MNRDRPDNFLLTLWIARIGGTLIAGLFFYIAVTEFIEEIQNNSPHPLATLINGQYFLSTTMALAFAGLVLAYWKEGLGGGISLAAFITFFIGWSDFHANFIVGMLLASLPSILYLVYWLGTRSYRRNLKSGKQEVPQ